MKSYVFYAFNTLILIRGSMGIQKQRKACGVGSSPPMYSKYSPPQTNHLCTFYSSFLSLGFFPHKNIKVGFIFSQTPLVLLCVVTNSPAVMCREERRQGGWQAWCTGDLPCQQASGHPTSGSVPLQTAYSQRVNSLRCLLWTGTQESDAAFSQGLSLVKGTSELDRCNPVSSRALPREADKALHSILEYYFYTKFGRGLFSFLCETSMDLIPFQYELLSWSRCWSAGPPQRILSERLLNDSHAVPSPSTLAYDSAPPTTHPICPLPSSF